ncbi:unnamed protein product [Meganyctiphanes norvegica]|uniref:Ig-like domain-containing protein n=1 Tax=Meganyctiphanes norvegica TaxID=48144 RepID=A0AAV2RUV2_MEGNR
MFFLCVILVHIIRLSQQHELGNETLLEKLSQMISQQHELYSQTVLQNLNHMMDARLSSLDIRINHIASAMNGIGLKQELKNQEIMSKLSQFLQEELPDNFQEVAANQNSKQAEYFDDNLTAVKTKLNLIESTLEDFTEKIEPKACGENLKSTSLLLQNEKNLLIFNPEDLALIVGQEARLYCGVIGEYSSCHWENNGAIYQVADVRNRVHLNLEEASNSSSTNQCGIIITSLRKNHYGIWNCEVLVAGKTLTASKTITSDKRWSQLQNACIRGNNYKIYHGLTIVDCKAKCVNEHRINCHSIDYHPQSQQCQISEAQSDSDDYTKPCYLDGWQHMDLQRDVDKRWSQLQNACIRGNNYKIYHGLTIVDCKAKCVNEHRINCHSIDYHPQSQQCQISEAQSDSNDYTKPCYLDGWQHMDLLFLGC